MAMPSSSSSSMAASSSSEPPWPPANKKKDRPAPPFALHLAPSFSSFFVPLSPSQQLPSEEMQPSRLEFSLDHSPHPPGPLFSSFSLKLPPLRPPSDFFMALPLHKQGAEPKNEREERNSIPIPAPLHSLPLARWKSSLQSFLDGRQPNPRKSLHSRLKTGLVHARVVVGGGSGGLEQETLLNLNGEEGMSHETILEERNDKPNLDARNRAELISAADRIAKRKRNRETAAQTAKHLFAGLISAVVSRTLIAPLERLKLEYMVRGATDNVRNVVCNILVSEGIGGLWKGNVVNLMRTAPFKSINFFSYDIYCKRLLEFTRKEEISNFEKLVVGAAAGITATLLCFPMDTIRTRMVAPGGEALGGVIGCMNHMVQNEGFLSLYKGLLPAVISMAPSGAVFYGVYDILKTSYLQSEAGQKDLRRRIEMERERRHKSGKVEGDLKEEAENLGQLELGPMRTLLYGAIAGICSESATYPFEVVRRHLQMQNAQTRMGALATCQKLVQKDGLTALYSGLLPSSLQVLPSAAISYFVYEYMKVFFKIT